MEEAKLPKRRSLSKVDRLSNLSDDLICHILSFLPTKDAYITSVLSTRWISLCTKVPDLHFKLPSLRNWNRKPSYSVCVTSNSILSVCVGLLRRTEKIRKLSLHSNDCESYASAIHMWVTKALDLGVKELDLHFVFSRNTIFLPRKLSTFESLVVLKLQGHIQPSLTSIAYLPSLKILHFEVTYWETMNVSRDYLSTFLSGCPRLEELQIRGRLGFPLEISLQFLKRLCLHLDYSLAMVLIRPLILNVPSIETLDMHDHSHHHGYEVVNLFNVDQATLNISKPLTTLNARFSLYKLMEGLSNVKSLYLHLCTTVQFLDNNNNLDNLRHLQFHNLLCLRVQIPLICNWDVLVAFLQNSPNLEILIIEKYHEINSKRSKVENSSWTKPTIIPTCLLTNFKVLEIRGSPYFQIELDFKKYIIENSAKLEKVILSTKERLHYTWENEIENLDRNFFYKPGYARRCCCL